MRTLHFQVQLRRAAGLRGETVAALIAGAAAKLRASEIVIQPKATYWNFNVRCRSLHDCDRVARVALNDKRLGVALRRCSIIACEGSEGWNNYLLLHHFDPRVALDRVLRRRARR